MKNEDEWVIIGRFGKPHGINGLITVNSFTDPRDNMLQYTDWHGHKDGNWQLLHLTSLGVKGKVILAKVEGHSTREEVASLTNTDIGVQRSQLPALPAGEYYWYQLLGMHVRTHEGALLGVVVDIMPTGSNDVLVVQGDKRHLIPYLVGQFVLTIDEAQRLITVDWDAAF